MKFVLALVLSLWMSVCNASCLFSFSFFPCTNSDHVTLYGQVNSATSHDVIEGIQTANKELLNSRPIYLFIDSPGGDVKEGGKIINAMESSRRPVYTVVIGQAASMAAYIEIYGVKRYMAPRSILMFHNASAGAIGEITHMASEVEILKKIVGEYNARLSEMTGLSETEIRLHNADEWWLTAKEAIDLKLVDDILNPSEYPPSP